MCRSQNTARLGFCIRKHNTVRALLDHGASPLIAQGVSRSHPSHRQLHLTAVKKTAPALHP
jgi:hypothetical protein